MKIKPFLREIYNTNLIVFLICCTILLTTTFPFQIVYFYYLLLTVCVSLTDLRLEHKRFILFFILFAVVIYSYFAKEINNVDLWSDETNILTLAQKSFEHVSQSAIHSHVVAPPVSYWLMWVWNKILAHTPVSYFELVARIPFMAFHIVASIFFTLALKKYMPFMKPHRLFVVMAIIYITYFFNPVLFVYSSIEVKFYGLTVLGSVIILYLMSTNQLFSLSLMPINLLFTLSSVFHYILIAPYVLQHVLDTSYRKNAILYIASSVYLFILLTASGILYPTSLPSAAVAYNVFNRNFRHFISLFFPSHLQLIVLVSLCIGLLFFKKVNRWIIAAVPVYLITLLVLQLYYKYYDLDIRQFIFVAPTLIFVLFYGVRIIPLRYISLYLLMICLLFTIPWVIKSWNLMKDSPWKFKDELGLKRVFSRATEEHKTVVLSIPTDFVTFKGHDVYLSNFAFYKTMYPNVPAITKIGDQNLCLLYPDEKGYIVFRFHDVYPCSNQ